MSSHSHRKVASPSLYSSEVSIEFWCRKTNTVSGEKRKMMRDGSLFNSFSGYRYRRQAEVIFSRIASNYSVKSLAARFQWIAPSWYVHVIWSFLDTTMRRSISWCCVIFQFTKCIPQDMLLLRSSVESVTCKLYCSEKFMVASFSSPHCRVPS